MIIRDLAQALVDLGLVLLLTLILLVILYTAGWVLKKRSLKIRARAERLSRFTSDLKRHEATNLSHKASFWEGISTELFGAVVTTIAFGIVLLVFQQYQSIQNRKAELILQMGSPDKAFAVEATRQLSVLEWLFDGTLQGANLRDANLEGANLGLANLEDANLIEANLQGASLIESNLKGANLRDANLQGANLGLANLEGANLRDANLQGANLIEANLHGASLIESNLEGADLPLANLEDAILIESNLEGANLSGANLQGASLFLTNLEGADLSGAKFSDRTLLPDAVLDSEIEGISPVSYWTPDTDMTRYTDPFHPDFWDACVNSERLHKPLYCIE